MRAFAAAWRAKQLRREQTARSHFPFRSSTAFCCQPGEQVSLIPKVLKKKKKKGGGQPASCERFPPSQHAQMKMGHGFMPSPTSKARSICCKTGGRVLAKGHAEVQDGGRKQVRQILRLIFPVDFPESIAGACWFWHM